MENRHPEMPHLHSSAFQLWVLHLSELGLKNKPIWIWIQRCPPSTSHQLETTSVPSHTHRGRPGLIKRLSNPEEVHVWSLIGKMVLIAECNLELLSSISPFPAPLSHYCSVLSPGSFSCCFILSPPFQKFGLSFFLEGSPGLLSLTTPTTDSTSCPRTFIRIHFFSFNQCLLLFLA